MENRTCKKCNINKPLIEFYKNGKYYKTHCKECDREQSAKYKAKNLEKVRKVNREYGITNKKKREDYQKEYYQKNRDWILEKVKVYWDKDENKKRRADLKRERWKVDENLRLSSNYRCRIYKALKGQKKSKSTEKLVGCSFIQLKQYLENLFTGGMTWDIYGEWHVDHIIPCASFDLTKIEEQEKCFHYTNLQPLWGYDNIVKRDNII